MALKYSSELLNLILSELPIEIAVLDINFKYVLVNNKAISNNQLRDWIIGKDDFEYCNFRKRDPEIAINRRKYFDKLFQTKAEVQWEEVLISNSGEELVFLRRYLPVKNEAEEIQYVIGYGVDSNESRYLRNELDEKSSLLELIFESSPSIMFLKDRKGRYDLVNKAFEELFNLSSDEIINKSTAEFHQEKSEVDHFSTVDNQVVNTLARVRVEEPFTSSNGKKIWLDTIKVPIKIKGEVKILGIATDITEKRKVQQNLIRNQELLEEAQEVTKSGSWEYYLAEKRYECSKGVFAILEIEAAESINLFNVIKSCIHPSDLAIFREFVNAVTNQVNESSSEIRLYVNKNIKYLKLFARVNKSNQELEQRIFGTVIDITDERLSKEIIRINEAKLIEAEKLSKSGSWEHDLESNILTWSPGFYRLWERDSNLGPPKFSEFLACLSKEEAKKLNQCLSELYLEGKSYEMEFNAINFAGKQISIVARGRREFDFSSKLFKVFGTVADITNQKIIEEKENRLQERLLEAEHLAKSGSWEFQFKTQQIFWSPGMYKLFKRDPSLGPPNYEEYLSWMPLEDRKKLIDASDNLDVLGLPFEIEHRIHNSEGELMNVEVRSAGMLKSSNETFKTYGTLTNITDRKKAEETLQANQKFLLEAQELAKFGSWRFDLLTGKIIWSDSMFKVFERDINLGTPSYQEYQELIHPDDLPQLISCIENAIDTGKEYSIEHRILYNGDKIKYVYGRGMAQLNNENKIIGLFGTASDVTEDKLVEETIINARIEKDANIKAREYFLANITHELRTPLNGVLGMTRLIQKTELSQTQRSYIDILGQTAENLLVIINDILDVAKIESGTLTIEKVPFNPFQISETAFQIQYFKAEEKDIILKHLRPLKPLPIVIGDPNRLNQILLNLLSNAIKFTKHGEVVLEHKIISESSKKIELEFSVRDTGIGIEESKLSQIFTSFSQVHDDGFSHYGGTGLGLSISKNLVELLGGKIWVESKLGVGSTFFFRIPYAKGVEKEVKEKNPIVISPRQLGKVRILLAEDNQVNQFITQAILLDWGFSVSVANNGKEVLELLEKSDFDLILMDIQMPEMNGLEATHLIRKLDNEFKSKLPIIALTANTTKNSQKLFISEGMNDYLIKPFKEDALLKKIQSHIKVENLIHANTSKTKFPSRKRPVLSNDQLYNLSLLKSDARDNPVFLKRMLTLFIETIPPIVNKMDQHFEKGEMDSISSLAHQIKPTLDGAGIFSLKATIRNIENYRDKKRTKSDLQKDLQDLRISIALVVKCFQKEIDLLNID